MIYKNKKYIIFSFIILFIIFFFLGCNKKEYKKYPFKNILDNEDIFDLVLYKNSIYAGGKNGLYKINLKDLSTNKIEKINLPYIKDLTVYDNNLYIGYDLGIIKYDGNNYTNILSKKNNFKDIRVNTIYFDSSGNLWAGTYYGVLKYKNNTWTNLSQKNGLLSNTVFLILEDKSGGMIFGHYASNKSGISYLKKNNWKYFNVDTGLPHNYITSGIIKNDKAYIGTGFYDKGGIAIFKVNNNNFELENTIIKKWGENGSKVRSIKKDNNLLLIGTEYNGLCLLKNNEFKSFTTNNNLIGNEVKNILILKNNLWIATKKGISIINKDILYSELEN